MSVDTINTTHTARSPLSITLSVWKALFLREAITRISQRRFAWFWLLAEPMLHTAVLMFIHTMMRPRVMAGMTRAVWVMLGVTAWLTFSRTYNHTMHAVKANKALFSYRQVKPLDAVLMRAALEGFVSIIVAICTLLVAGLVGLQFVPDDPLATLAPFVAVWMIGTGYGLVTSVANELVPEVEEILPLIMIPLWFISSVIIPMTDIARPYRDWILFNPLAHCLEAFRMGFSRQYHSVPEISVSYPLGFGLTLIFFGLLLHKRFATRLASR